MYYFKNYYVMKKEDFIQIFPKEAEAIKHSPNVPFQGTIGLPCNNVVPECWILFLEDELGRRTLVCERSGHSYTMEGHVPYKEIS